MTVSGAALSAVLVLATGTVAAAQQLPDRTFVIEAAVLEPAIHPQAKKPFNLKLPAAKSGRYGLTLRPATRVRTH